MAKGNRANLERLLRSAWETQHQLRSAEGQVYTMPNMPAEPVRPKIDWRDLFLAGLALLIEALALLYGVSVLALAAAAILWFALRGYRRERNFKKSLGFDIGSGLLLVVITTVLPIGAKMHFEHQSKPQVPPITPTESPKGSVQEPARDYVPPAKSTNAQSSKGAPVELVTFDSNNDISIANNESLSIYAVSLVINVRKPRSSKSFGLGFEIEPGDIKKYPISDGFRQVRSIEKLADTWDEHYDEALALYQTCGIQLTFFSPFDPRFKQMKSFQTKYGRGLDYDNASAVLLYRVKGFPETKKQSVPIVVTATINDAVCAQPHD